MEFWKIAFTLFIIIDPFGNIPVISSILRTQDESRHRAILTRELLIGLLLFIAFIFIGDYLLPFLGLHESSIRISGGVVLFLVALGMIFPSKSVLTHERDEEPFIVPIAVPLIAGPSMLAMLMLLAQQHPGERVSILGATGLAWLASAIVILLTPQFIRILGRKGLRATERLMGMLLIMISVQMLLNGITTHIKTQF